MAKFERVVHAHPDGLIFFFGGKGDKSWVPERGSIRDRYQHIPPIYGLFNGCIGQYGVIFWEELLGYPPQVSQIFPLRKGVPFLEFRCSVWDSCFPISDASIINDQRCSKCTLMF